MRFVCSCHVILLLYYELSKVTRTKQRLNCVSLFFKFKFTEGSDFVLSGSGRVLALSAHSYPREWVFVMSLLFRLPVALHNLGACLRQYIELIGT
jgi:hypothetical protein